ncbi:MAG: Crp/Fnr family transcriptional regulator [Clostridia bacterium]|nr:Crp/Fnr family transcriptional regulator [Clostridia bacterium]MBR3974413.1 Crp/Fnr family transcriptional regulator [Clostridia bacterium]
MRKYLEVLKNCPLFQNIEDENLLHMLTCLGARTAIFDKKYTVMSEGYPAKYIGIVLSGSVQITQTDYYGNRSILSNIEKSGVFAEAFACAGTKAIPITVTANEQSEIMFIDCAPVLRTCAKNCAFHTQLIFNLMKDLADKTIVFHQKIEIISKRTTREKLLSYLLFQSKKTGSDSFEIPFDRQELADYLEVDRSGLSAEISKLRNEGILQSHKKHFTLLK